VLFLANKDHLAILKKGGKTGEVEFHLEFLFPEKFERRFVE
jgi:hypothetical protein